MWGKQETFDSRIFLLEEWKEECEGGRAPKKNDGLTQLEGKKRFGSLSLKLVYSHCALG